ncbi:metallophosphoesterase [Methanosphaera sp. ISO3-F5]|uniref:metallophosphoesterase family protein n=1 Tax=Methanosphaera sp. ISO3-F5 TaxID=1452353 RepID=UPI002B2613D2|nr:metallophosphoesterase [Methanosphaera sp. ISO3-F5]WQH64914.1 metallophosphoesterase [Methanosphaera sp. ISO3-F5]
MTKIVHMSDLHIGFANFREDILLNTINKINKLNPEAVVISGDITDNGYYREFVKVKEYLDLLIPPTIVIPGNHDARNIGDEVFEEIIGDRYSTLDLEESNIKIIGLDSSEPDLDHGKIGRLQKRFLEREIKDAEDRNMFIIITVHHHIISIPNTGRERNVLSDAGDVLLLLLENNVNLVLSGHKHVPHVWKMNNTIFSTAGTVSSMKLRGNTHPSYNIIDINDDKVQITLVNNDGSTEVLTPP